MAIPAPLPSVGPLRLPLFHPATCVHPQGRPRRRATPAPGRSGGAAAPRWARGQSRGQGVATGGGRAPEGSAKMPFVFPIRRSKRQAPIYVSRNAIDLPQAEPPKCLQTCLVDVIVGVGRTNYPAD